ncbi:calmodulin, partial [Colletotrichum higginsianum]
PHPSTISDQFFLPLARDNTERTSERTPPTDRSNSSSLNFYSPTLLDPVHETFTRFPTPQNSKKWLLPTVSLKSSLETTRPSSPSSCHQRRGVPDRHEVAWPEPQHQGGQRAYRRGRPQQRRRHRFQRISPAHERGARAFEQGLGHQQGARCRLQGL